MGYFNLNTPPTWAPNAYATEAGWVDATTGELLVAIRGLATRRTTGATPYAASFTTTNSKTKLKTNDTITLTVTFNEKVTVTGTPQISLTIGVNTRQASYLSGSGSNILLFRYTVVSGDTGNWTAIGSSISLNGGTIKDTNDGTTNSVLTGVGALFSSTSNYSVDNTAPVISDVVLYGGARYATGSVMRFKVPLDEVVTVTGTPTLTFDIGVNTRAASYVSGSGTTNLYFEYTVVSGDSAVATGVVVDGKAISLNGGTITDSAGNTPVLTGLNGEAFIDTAFVNTGSAAASATVSSVTATGASYGFGSNFDITVTMSGRCDVVGTPQFTFLINGASAVANYVSGSGTTALVFRYTLVGGNTAASGQVTYAANPISLNGGTIKNSSLVAATLTKTAATFSSVIFDTTYPSVSSTAFTGLTHPAYVTNDTLSLTLTFNQAVTVTGTPTISMGIGQLPRTMSYASGSGTTALVFSYTVVAGDIAKIPGQGFSIDNVITLSGGTIADAAGNAAVLTFRRPSKTSITFNA